MVCAAELRWPLRLTRSVFCQLACGDGDYAFPLWSMETRQEWAARSMLSLLPPLTAMAGTDRIKLYRIQASPAWTHSRKLQHLQVSGKSAGGPELPLIYDPEVTGLPRAE